MIWSGASAACRSEWPKRVSTPVYIKKRKALYRWQSTKYYCIIPRKMYVQLCHTLHTVIHHCTGKNGTTYTPYATLKYGALVPCISSAPPGKDRYPKSNYSSTSRHYSDLNTRKMYSYFSLTPTKYGFVLDICSEVVNRGCIVFKLGFVPSSEEIKAALPGLSLSTVGEVPWPDSRFFWTVDVATMSGLRWLYFLLLLSSPKSTVWTKSSALFEKLNFVFCSITGDHS